MMWLLRSNASALAFPSLRFQLDGSQPSLPCSPRAAVLVPRAALPDGSSSNWPGLSKDFIGSAAREREAAAPAETGRRGGDASSIGAEKGAKRRAASKEPAPSSRAAPASSSPDPAAPPSPQQLVTVQATRRGRGGKTVTVVSGLPLREAALGSLARELKARLGTGGAVKDGEVEIQGDHALKLTEELRRRGYNAKKSGG